MWDEQEDEEEEAVMNNQPQDPITEFKYFSNFSYFHFVGHSGLSLSLEVK